MNIKLYSSDEEIILGIKNKDERALTALYKANFAMIANFVFLNNGTEQEAKDIYQECIIAFYEKISSGQLELTCKIKTYIYSVCRRLWLKKLIEKKRVPGKISDFENYVEVEDELPEINEKEERFDAMANALKKLGEPCKTIIEDFYVSQLSMEEIADKFGYTNSGNAKNQKYKCLQRLKKIFFLNYEK